jgi:hypothetical protein
MNGLLVLSLAAAASAQVVLPYGGLHGAYAGLGYAGLGHPYAGLGYAHPYAIAKPVVTEVEVPVPVIEYKAHVTGCANSFGHAVPCLQEGEARRKRAADEEAAAPAVVPHLAYAGLHGAYPYAGLGYAGHLGYAGLGYPYAAPVEVEVPVTQYKYVPEVQTIELPPACQNHLGFAVPCA